MGAKKQTDGKTNDKKTATKKVSKKAKYHFVKLFKTQSKEYKKDDPCFETNEKVLQYLINNKFIK